MPSIGIGEIVFVLAVLVLLFGAKRIPEIARGLGSGIRNFKGRSKPDGPVAGAIPETTRTTTPSRTGNLP